MSPGGSHHCPQECQVAGVGYLPCIFGWLTIHRPARSLLLATFPPGKAIPVVFPAQSSFLFWFARSFYERSKGSCSKWLIFLFSVLRTISLCTQDSVRKIQGYLTQSRGEILPARIQKWSSGGKAPWFALPNCSGKSNHECKLSKQGK